MKVERGEIKKLMIFCPPRHGKSELISYKFPTWFLGRNPDKRVIHSSYSASLSNTFSKKDRDLIQDKRYRLVFDEVNVRQDSRAGDHWDLQDFKGGMISSGVGGAITGYGADLFIIDDPVKNQEEAESEVMREKVWEWYKAVARTRLEPNGKQVLIMTRWHRHDLAGKILAEQDDWVVINLPALAEENDPLGRSVGQALWRSRYDEANLIQTQREVGSRVWNALFQGNPVDPASQIIKRHWIKYYKELPPECMRGGGIDTATSLKTSADNMAFVDVCRDQEGWLYVDDVFCEKITVSAFAHHVCNQHKIKNYSQIKLESNNAGEAVHQRIEEVGRETQSYPAINVEATTTDKVIRVMEFQHLIENGTIKFKEGNKKVADLIEHLISFDGKGSEIDDDVDALGFAIKAIKDDGVMIWGF